MMNELLHLLREGFIGFGCLVLWFEKKYYHTLGRY